MVSGCDNCGGINIKGTPHGVLFFAHCVSATIPSSQKFDQAKYESETRNVLHLAQNAVLYNVSTGKQCVTHVYLLYFQPVGFPAHSAARTVMTSYELSQNRRSHFPHLKVKRLLEAIFVQVTAVFR
jgi:hypothetical protein